MALSANGRGWGAGNGVVVGCSSYGNTLLALAQPRRNAFAFARVLPSVRCAARAQAAREKASFAVARVSLTGRKSHAQPRLAPTALLSSWQLGS